MLALVVVGLALVVTALVQIRSTAPARTERTLALSPAGDGSAAPPTRVELDVFEAALVVTPGAPGVPLRVTADFDPSDYALETDRGAGDEGLRIRFGPRGSHAMALLRLKLGGAQPTLRVRLPRGTRLSIVGRLEGGFAAIELGGLDVDATDLRVSGGAVTVSVARPTASPMDSFAATGHAGSLEVTGLGNASPRRARIDQRLGAIDLDLRGAWLRDAEIEVVGHAAGGSVWLPDNVKVERQDAKGRGIMIPDDERAESPRPRLTLRLEPSVGRLVVIGD